MVDKSFGKQKLAIALEGFGAISLLCALNASIVFFSYAYLFKTKFINFFQFKIPIEIGGISLEFPYAKKKLLPLLLLLGISAAITNVAVEVFAQYKIKYKKILSEQGLIEKQSDEKKGQDENKKQNSRALYIALCTFGFVSLRNFLREPRDIAQLFFNNIEIINFSFFEKNIATKKLIKIILIIILITLICFIDFFTKLSKKIELRICDSNKKSDKKLKTDCAILPIIPKIKEKLYKLDFFKKNDLIVNDAIIVVLSTIPGLFISKIFKDLGILNNLKINFYINDGIFSFLDNSNFLITYIFIDFFFTSLFANILFRNIGNENNLEETYDSLCIIKKDLIPKTILVVTINSLLFAVGLSMTFSIERIISNIDELNKFQDIAKIMLILTASYLMITCAYTLPKTLLEISEAKKAFTNHQNKDQ